VQELDDFIDTRGRVDIGSLSEQLGPRGRIVLLAGIPSSRTRSVLVLPARRSYWDS
jgi:hypothetical protein